MEDLSCGSCGEHIGWISDNAPRGSVRCDSCKERDDQESESESDDFC